MRLVSSPAMSFRKSAALTPAAQTTSSAGRTAAVGEPHAVGQHLGDLGAGVHLDAELAQQLRGGLGQALRQRRQHAVGGLDQVDLDVLVGIDAVEAVGHDLARRAVQLGGQLDAGGAGADDRHVQLLGPQRRRSAHARGCRR